ncbi:MAG: hypothetical protein NZ707_08630, partial [Rhodospirillales bacterium]|nr:hypothetical protein [Rhodospirillales bacterium]
MKLKCVHISVLYVIVCLSLANLRLDNGKVNSRPSGYETHALSSIFNWLEDELASIYTTSSFFILLVYFVTD